MNNNGRRNSPIPREVNKKKTRIWQLLLILFFLLFVYVTTKTSRDRGLGQAFKTANEDFPKLVSASSALSPEESKRADVVADMVINIYRKYLSPDEFNKYLAINKKVENGTFNIDDLNLSASYLKKIFSVTSASEIETINEWGRIAQKLSLLMKEQADVQKDKK